MLTWLNIIEIFIIVLMVYAFYVSFIKNTSSEKLVRGLFGLGVIWALSFLLPMVHLHLLGRFLHWLALFLSVALIVIFQPELRKFLALMGNIRGWKNIIYAFRQDVKNSSNKQKSVEEIIKAVTYMSEKHTGALIVFPEDIDDGVIERYGTKIDAIISSELLLTIFFNKYEELHLIKKIFYHCHKISCSGNMVRVTGQHLGCQKCQNQLFW